MNNALYDGAKFALATVFRTLWRMRVHGRENVPGSGPLIVSCNHVSYLDPPVLGTACPRRIQYMAKQELFAIPVLGPAIAAVGAYPVDRHGSAKSAIKRSLEVLAAGGAIGIFPEGTRNRDGTRQPQVGVALLAQLSGAPVVPAAVTGTLHPRRLKRIEVYFGEPMQLPAGGKPSRADLEHFALDVMQTIRSLPEARHR